MTSYITDWSNHNSGALTTGQANGLVSFWHKRSDGDHWYEDPTFKPHVDMARSLGVDSLGGYPVVWGNRDLNSQARWFVDLTRRDAPDALIFMSDNEPFGYNAAPSIDQVNAFNQAVADYARVPASSVLAYCPQWFYGSAISGLRFPWIQSNYGSNPTGPYATVYQQTVGDQSSRWNGPAPMPFLQYGSRTDVGDANAFRGDTAAFFAFIKSQPPAEEEDMPLPYFLASDDVNDIYLVTGAIAASGKIAAFPLGLDQWNAHKALGLKSVQLKVRDPSIYDYAPQPWPSGGGSTPPAAASYTVSVSGSLPSVPGPVSLSGTARPMPPANGQ